MDNRRFTDEEDLPLVRQDEDYDNYKAPDTSRIDETSLQCLIPQKQHQRYN